MGGVPLPEGYHSVNPYIVVDDADRLIDFLVEVFSAFEQLHGQVRSRSSLDSELRQGRQMTKAARTAWTPWPKDDAPPRPASDVTFLPTQARGGHGGVLAAEPLSEGVLHRRLDAAARCGHQVADEDQLAGGVATAEPHRGVAGNLTAMAPDLAVTAQPQPYQPEAVTGTGAELFAGVYGGLHRLEEAGAEQPALSRAW
jgi:hypothetical protein